MGKSVLKFSLAVTVFTMVAGCASWYPETKADSDESVELALQSLNERLDSAEDRLRQNSDFESSQPWLVAEEVQETTRYPKLDEIKIKASLFNQTLPQMSGRLTELSGVSIELASDLYQSSGSNSGSSQPQNNMRVQLEPTEQAVNTENVMQILGRASFGEAGAERENPLGQPISVSVNNDSITKAFDQIATRLGISWRYNKNLNVVTFFRLERRNFQIFFPGLAESEIDVGRSGGNDNVIQQTSGYEMEGGDWDEISEAMQSLMTPFGRATVVKSTGNIVVTDTPEGIKNVEDYVENLNDTFGRQVYLQIRTATVSVENTNDFNLTWNNILNTVNNGATQIGAQSASIASQSLPNALNVIRTANGASLALELLAKETQNTEINEQSVTTLSNQPASLKVLTETGYISGISQQDSSGFTPDNVVSDVQTDTVNVGFDATLIPRVVSSSTLQLQVALELSSNLTLVNFDSTIVQTPTRDRNAVVQRAWLKDGETWILAAFTSERTSEEETGSGTSGFWGLGGGTSRAKERQVLLVMITPHIQRGVF